MKRRIIEALFATISAFAIWLALSYIFFPIKLSAPPSEYFLATITHMVPLKIAITIIFVLTILFICEQRVKKHKNK